MLAVCEGAVAVYLVAVDGAVVGGVVAGRGDGFVNGGGVTVDGDWGEVALGGEEDGGPVGGLVRSALAVVGVGILYPRVVVCWGFVEGGCYCDSPGGSGHGDGCEYRTDEDLTGVLGLVVVRCHVLVSLPFTEGYSACGRVSLSSIVVWDACVPILLFE